MRQQKQKMSRQVRDKEEELDTSLQKIDTLRQDIRKAEKLRRELQLRAEDALNEVAKERKLREKAEAHAKQLEKDIPVRSGMGSGGGGAGTPEDSADVARLREELERLEVTTQESLLEHQSKYNSDVSALREQLEESERRSRAHESDVQALRDKLDRSRMDSLQESEDTMKELRGVHEREKLMLVEENKKLQVELERVADINGRMHVDRRQLEEEYAELRSKKEAIAHWEQQISEIINWVSDEKDARGYLQVEKLTLFSMPIVLFFFVLCISGSRRQNDGGAGIPETLRSCRRRRSGPTDPGREELEEPAVTEAGEDGAAQPAVQSSVRNPREAGHQRGA